MPPSRSYTYATAYAPATVANLGPGFDILGLSLSSPGDTVTVRLAQTPGVTLTSIEGDGGELPLEPTQNTAGVAAAHVLQAVAPDEGVTLQLKKGLPLGCGLGSSGTSAVAAAIAVNALFGSPLTRAELLPACIAAEAVVSGPHADNVAAGLMGGIVLVVGPTANDVFRLSTPPGLHLAVITPGVSVSTAEARAVLPERVSLGAMVHQTAQVGLIMHALHRGDIALLARAVGNDQVIEDARAPLMPYFREAQAIARRWGALATVISGAGPTVCAFCASHWTARDVAQNVKALYESKGVTAAAQATTVAQGGARVLALG